MDRRQFMQRSVQIAVAGLSLPLWRAGAAPVHHPDPVQLPRPPTRARPDYQRSTAIVPSM